MFAKNFPTLRHKLLRWYDKNRRDLPWRRTADPYAIWISETMLQQTQVTTVLRYYEKFLGAFPTLQALDRAPLEQVLRALASPEAAALGRFWMLGFLETTVPSP